MNINPDDISETPCYVCEEEKLRGNLETIRRVREESGATIILALKGFSMFSVFPMLKGALLGTAASSLNEARLGFEEFGKKVHLYAPAYREDEFEEISGYSSHITFNSFGQWKKFRERLKGKDIRCGIRINPEHSEVTTGLYNPCSPYSRLGVTLANFEESELEGISGLHFHVLCENNSDALERVVDAVEKKFSHLIGKMNWVNFGGGHHITRDDYDIERLIRIVKRFRERWGVEVILEPGEAIALNAGVLVATVLDIVNNGMKIAILDTSASAHMPDVLEMPYRPRISGAGEPEVFEHLYRLGGMTCLAGDVIGDYSFPEPLKIGDKLVFGDMLHYTMVKNTTFNGVQLPSIGIWSEKEGFRIIRKFGYEDYRNRLS